jgi:Tfp pilus assembly protein PilX
MKSRPASLAHDQRGSVILIVLIFTTVLALIAGSLLSYTLTERRLNHGNTLRFQAKNAAEAALEYAASETRARLTNNLNFASNEFATAPITAHSTRLSTLLQQGTGEWNAVDPTEVELWASQVSEPVRRFVDPNNAGNDFDPLRGQTVGSQSVRFIAKAVAEDTVNEATTYATQSIEIRDAALFNYAIFYNLDMEFHPGPNMTVVGPVHSNESSYLTEGGGLTFTDTMTTASDFVIGTKNSPGSRPSGKDIKFSTGVDDDGDGDIDLLTVNNPSINGTAVGSYIDSGLASRVTGKNFRDVASQAWNGYVQDRSHGISRQSPPGVLTGPAAHDLIEAPDATGPAAVEEQKFSNKAGLYFVVESDGDVFAFNDPIEAQNFKASTNRSNWITSNPRAVVVPPPGLIENQRRMYDWREREWINTIDFDLGVMRTAVLAASAGSVNNFKVDGGDWDLDDPAVDGQWNGVVYVDVEAPTSGFASSGLTYKPDASTTISQGAGNGSRTAVRLLNASDLPNRRDADPTNAFLPEGLSVATNAPVYTVGHFNADGTLQSDLSDMTTPEANEVPAAIIADAVNILSAAWDTTDFVTGQVVPAGDIDSNSSSRPNAAHTEVSSAFLTGIVSTTGTSNSQYSGGVENYPRFHERWNGRSLRYRGSIVALFESEVATGTWHSAKYGAPRREWGFNSMFGSQRRYPPGSPIIRTFRRLDYRDITKAEWDALKGDTNLAFTQM